MEPRRRFRFLKELAQGGFGKVYLAEMITGDNFSSVVAIKLLHGRWLDNDEIVMRSRDEARLLGRLRHRNIVRVEDLTSINGQCAIVMEYLQGADLKATNSWFREHGLTFPRQSLFEIISAVASALDGAYNHRPIQGGEPLRVIHRDIKPSNIMVTIDGEVKVLDFGTARAHFEDREARTQAMAFGSQAYMAPERLLAEPDTPAADVFSLGVTLYESLTLDVFGKIFLRPDRYESALEERLKKVSWTPLPANLQADATETLRGMLAYDPTARPTAAQVVELMESLTDEARDMGLKRLARETVKEVLQQAVVDIDPHDPLTGTTVVEDISAFSKSDPPPSTIEEDNPFKVPPELAEDAPLRPSSPRPDAPPPPPPRLDPPPPPRNTSSVIPISPPAEPRLVEPRPADPRPAEPRLVEPRPADPRPAEPRAVEPRAVEPRAVAPRPPPPAEAPPEPPSGAGRKVAFALLGLLVLVGVVGGAVWFLVIQPSMQEPGGAGEPAGSAASGSAASGSATAGTPSAAVAGASDKDFSPNATGKGGAILTIPAGSGTVAINGTGYRQEWDGTGFLRLKDLEPGVFRAKVPPKGGGPSAITDFKVEANQTCVFTFQNGTWEKSECR